MATYSINVRSAGRGRVPLLHATFRGQGAAITSFDKLIEMVAREEVDLVAVGRALLVDPAWAAKARDNRMQDLLPFTPEPLRSLS